MVFRIVRAAVTAVVLKHTCKWFGELNLSVVIVVHICQPVQFKYIKSIIVPVYATGWLQLKICYITSITLITQVFLMLNFFYHHISELAQCKNHDKVWESKPCFRLNIVLYSLQYLLWFRYDKTVAYYRWILCVMSGAIILTCVTRRDTAR